MTDGSGKYARAELERRFLPGGVPDGLVPRARIEDRYLDGTRLRLRTVTAPDGTVVRKLGQKVRVDPADPSAVWLTNLYLDEAEHAALAVLPGRPLVKERFAWPGTDFVVDVFAGALDGLVLAECERSDPASLAAVVPPPGPGREVTHDDSFSGGSLAALSAEGLSDLLG